jgi:hypothetical protein
MLNNIICRSIDESTISQLTIEQLTQIERKVEYVLGNTKARKVCAVQYSFYSSNGQENKYINICTECDSYCELYMAIVYC